LPPPPPPPSCLMKGTKVVSISRTSRCTSLKSLFLCELRTRTVGLKTFSKIILIYAAISFKFVRL